MEQSRPGSERKFKDNFLDRWRKQDLARSNSAASSRENSDKCKLMQCEETERRRRLHAKAIEQTKSSRKREPVSGREDECKREKSNLRKMSRVMRRRDARSGKGLSVMFDLRDRVRNSDMDAVKEQSQHSYHDGKIASSKNIWSEDDDVDRVVQVGEEERDPWWDELDVSFGLGRVVFPWSRRSNM